MPKRGFDAFRELIRGYYAQHGRDLPWRRTRDPYAILISEVMLQQTQVPRVIPKYAAFLGAFPDVFALAEAPLADVLAAWSGLGYNRRAKWLKQAAETIVAQYGGSVPDTLEGLTALPGIGHATAAQILAFAFGVAVPFIETNIRSVYIHEFFGDADGVPDSAIMPLVEATLDRDDPRTWYYAIMDYGTHLKATLPNPSRRSAHHAYQPRFEGSMRQVRGALVREVAVRPGQDAGALAAAVGFEPGRVASALDALTAEGFFSAKNGVYRIS
ncbi:MAG: A/G-specific adenine glycosylase [Actinomycetia bacterium]|nr:A/G-specific adenine glycosylase [Actinomycetes bacterium]